ncbi:alkaline phytoceramidase [Athelia psychrophila]|uniref:Alkaline phytoceramidase n=1 Tax=Athelia psychrophila TaxID=1759441 RepID=A0A166NQY2_9AGAM|nr:alkaline phytoceramidase [Fibularhizoctonia sp. CBS 109695]
MTTVYGNSTWPVGVWGPVTATLDWCEANYQFSKYIAEMTNTVSNVFSIWIALYGAIIAQKEDLPTRLTIGSLGFTLVGVGSFAFHATLLRGAQLADELPMIYVSSYGLFCLFDTKGRDFSRRSWLLAAALLVFNALFTWSYIVSRDPVYHQLVFGFLVFTTAFRTHYLLTRSADSAKIPAHVRATIGRMFALGFALFSLGFISWNVDNIYCDVLTRYKKAVGWPLAFLLEGHAWWHIFTGIGTQLMMNGITYTTLSIKDDYRNYKIGRNLGVPYIQRVSGKKVE